MWAQLFCLDPGNATHEEKSRILENTSTNWLFYYGDDNERRGRGYDYDCREEWGHTNAKYNLLTILKIY